MSGIVLSPEEIQALLADHSDAGPVSGLWEGNTAPYDLLKADVDLADKLSNLEQINLQITDHLKKELMALLGEGLNITAIANAEFVSGADTLAALNLDQELVSPWNNKLSDAQGCVSINRNLFFCTYGYLLGGKRLFNKAGALTSLEEKYYTTLISNISAAMNNAWNKFGKYELSLSKYLPDNESLQQLVWNFDCFSVTFEFSFDENKGEIKIYFPKEMLLALGVETSSQAGTIAGTVDHVWCQAVREAIADMAVPVQVQLGTILCSLAEAINLNVDQDKNIITEGDALPIFVNGKQLFYAQMGAVDGHRAVQLI